MTSLQTDDIPPVEEENLLSAVLHNDAFEDLPSEPVLNDSQLALCPLLIEGIAETSGSE